MICPLDEIISSFIIDDVLYATPDLDTRDLEVIEGIEAHRALLRHHVAQPRRWNGQLRRNLRARAMRGSNSIEGYDVSLDDAVALLEDEEPLDADHRTVLEVRGYRNAMTYVQRLAGDPDFALDPSLVRGLHFMMLGHDLAKNPGSYRRGEIYVRDEDADEVVYTGPDPELVPPLVGELLDRLDTALGDATTPVVVTAAMAHLNLVMIHPFSDGNGRMARCLQTMILARNQILAAEFSSIEEWLGRNTSAYYDVLSSTGRGAWHPGNDATEWVKFNLKAHHMQAQTVAERVNEAEALWQRLAELVADRKLPDRVTAGLWPAALGLRLRRPAYESDAEVEPGTAGRDLRALVAAGLLEPRGETRGRHYVGSADLREVYATIRRDRSRPYDPYGASTTDLSPRRRRRLGTGQ